MKKDDKKIKWKKMIMIILGLWVLSFFIASMIGSEKLKMGNTAVIDIKGVIMVDSGKSLMTGRYTSSDEIVELIEEADNNPTVEAIIFNINSPGGSAVASDEIATKIKEINKTTIAWIREIGTSGAYWIASATDTVIANKMSITGSVGVIASYLEFSDFLDDKNITYQRLVAGQYKDLGSPFKKLTTEEKDLFQGQLDQMHNIFLEEVKTNRDLTNEAVDEIKTARFFLGLEAQKLGLVDQLGGKKEVLAAVEQAINKTPELSKYETKKGFFDILAESFTNKNIMLSFEKTNPGLQT